MQNSLNSICRLRWLRWLRGVRRAPHLPLPVAVAVEYRMSDVGMALNATLAATVWVTVVDRTELRAVQAFNVRFFF